MKHPCSWRYLVAGLIATLVIARPAQAQAEAQAQAKAKARTQTPLQTQAQQRESLERRLEQLTTLIETSSVARQIESSGEAGARAKRDNARLIHREASLTLKAGDQEAAAKLMDAVAQEMMGGARLARPDQINGAKALRDFTARLESARALLTAQQRITTEKGNAPEAAEATRRIATLIADAEQRAKDGKVDEARPIIDRAYLIARISIESLRRGDTLVRSLVFSSKREEFEYEIDRNDTHLMLIRVLTADRKDLIPMVQPFIDRSTVLRSEAEAKAKEREHEAAVKTLEAATRELVRAIRAGGIYIPG